MNDYKELIEILRDDEFCGKLDYIDDAADAIEQLVKERDAAMADIRVSCRTCRHSYLNNASGSDCDSVGSYACNWEWRGVQEDNDGLS